MTESIDETKPTIYALWLASAMMDARLSQYRLALKSGVPQPTIQRIIKGTTLNPSADTLQKLAEALKTDLPDSRTGARETSARYHANVQEERRSIVRVPLISWVAAGQMCESPDLYHPGDSEEWTETSVRVSASSYALRVVGDSMTNPHGSPSIPDGCVVIIDPEAEAVPGKIVVVKRKNQDDATLKKLVVDGSLYFLKPLNPAYPLTQLTDEHVICGVAKQVVQNL